MQASFMPLDSAAMTRVSAVTLVIPSMLWHLWVQHAQTNERKFSILQTRSHTLLKYHCSAPMISNDKTYACALTFTPAPEDSLIPAEAR